MSKHLEERAPFKFFALTILFSWGFWLPAIALWLNDYGMALYMPLAVLGQFAPLAAAATLIAPAPDTNKLAISLSMNSSKPYKNK